jgi:hypothetical protein
MASSTTNLIQAVNRVLLDCGERQVTSISNPAANKAKEYLRDALAYTQAIHDWEWMYDKKIATGWINESATVEAQQIRRVLWHNGDYNEPVFYLDSPTFDLQTLQPFDSATETAQKVRYYTISTYNTIRVNPYPTDSVGQSRVTFHVIGNLVFPATETDVFPLPEKYMPLLYARAGYLMAVRHLEDRTAAQFYDKDYQEMVLRYRSQENKTPTHGINMYRSRFRRFHHGV